jgi:VanZ family protein
MFWKFNYLGVSWAVFILVLSGLPGDQFEQSKLENADKVIHVFLYGVLVFLLAVGFLKQSSFRQLKEQTLRKVALMAVVYGILVEGLQATVFVGRSIEVSDMLFNGVGVIIGLGVFGSIYGIRAYF